MTHVSDSSLTATPSAGEAMRAARESVLVVRLADRAGIRLRGKERTSWLNGLVTCDLAKLGEHDAAYGLLVEKKGRIQTDFFVVQGKDDLVLAVPASLRDQLQETLDHYLIMEDVEIEPADVAFWQLHGPSSAKVLDAIGSESSGIRRGGALDPLGVGGGGILAAPLDVAAEVEGKIAAAVNAASGHLADEPTWEVVRIAYALPRFGVEVDTTLYPQEASLEKLAVSFQKGCYLGQEVVYMLENRGHVKRKLVGLDIDATSAEPSGAAISTPEGAAVGDVKSSVVGPNGKAVAIAMVKWAQAKPGTELRVGEHLARVR